MGRGGVRRQGTEGQQGDMGGAACVWVGLAFGWGRTQGCMGADTGGCTWACRGTGPDPQSARQSAPAAASAVEERRKLTRPCCHQHVCALPAGVTSSRNSWAERGCISRAGRAKKRSAVPAGDVTSQLTAKPLFLTGSGLWVVEISRDLSTPPVPLY